jgi:Protein of unknown function (DUF1217)
MVSTYLSYDLVSRDISSSLKRVSQQSDVSREATYYKENINKVTSVDEFLDDYRLYSYAMKAYGLEDMTYATAFMRKILESDLNDENSFANKLSDDRYRDFATAFNFSKEETTAQSSTQVDSMVDLYTSTMVSQGDEVTTETNYFNAMMDEVSGVDELLNNDRLRDYLLTSYDLDKNYYSRSTLRGVLSSDTSDPSSYINQTLGPQRDTLNTQIADAEARLESADAAGKKTIQAEISGYESKLDSIQKYYDIADAFEFNADYSAPSTGAQTAEQKATVNSLYLSQQDRLTSATATSETAYFKEKMATVDNVDDIIGDSRLYSYIRTAYNLTGVTVVSATIEQILTSDLDDPNSYVNRFSGSNPEYLELAKAFNFNTDGTVEAGSAQTSAQTQGTTTLYNSLYNDAQEEADEKAISLYKTAISEVESVDDFLADSDVYQFALKAVGLDPDEVSAYTLKRVLKSDLQDPKSYVNTLGDERYVTLAKAFNFTAEGDVGTPLTAQSQSTITSIGSDYIVKMARFLDEDAAAEAKETAQEEVSYYSEKMMSVETASEVVNDERLMNVLLTSYGVDPESVDSDFLKQVFSSDLSDEESFVNQQTNTVWAEILGTFNFDAEGNLTDDFKSGIQSRGKILETENRYTRQSLEENEGEENEGVRMALYFERMSASITSAYDILGDTALQEFFRVSYQLPDSFSNLDIDKQAALVEKYMNLEDLKDPEKVSKMVDKFTVLYDLENSEASSSALSILTATSSSVGISADLLEALA